MPKPHAIIFSSGTSHSVAEAVKENLERQGFIADTWKENFFDANNTAPLNTFLKKLLCFDFAVLVLGADDLRVDPVSHTPISVPRDNVVFELGATMARMGTQKTFLLVPTSPPVTLPTYFKGIGPLHYEPRPDGNFVAGTGTACRQIRDRMNRLDEDAFHSDLPALGLAYGYFHNFVRPIHDTLREVQRIDTPGGYQWSPDKGYSLTIVVPDRLMNRQTIDEYMKTVVTTTNVHVLLKDGRDVSVYVLPRTSSDSPLNILDTPTTLLTSEKIIRRVDNFWGSGDREFRDRLTQRETVAFGRRMRGLIAEEQLSSKRVAVVELSELPDRVASLLSQ